MTRDHVIAKSLGGQDFLSNMQTMCRICNNKKGSMTVEQWNNYFKNKH
jgi:5-methylcytosine-specific restriction endonuclease McrA